MLKTTITTLFILFFLLVSSSSACDKNDIDYYLDKGFTHDQVTKMCSASSNTKTENKRSYKSYREDYVDKQDEDYIKRMRIERQVFLKSAIAAKKIRISRGVLSFIEYACAREGLARDSEARIEGCAVVKTSVKLSEIEVLPEPKRERVFFGQYLIQVTGNINKEIIGGFEGLDQYGKDKLRKKIEHRFKINQGYAGIPIKKGLDFNYALESFNDIVNFEKDLANKIVLENNMGGSLKDDDLNITNSEDFLIEEKKGFSIRFSNDETIEDEIIFDDIDESQISNDEIPDEVFN
jgi:hypothetical protein